MKRPRRRILALALVGAVAVAVGLVVFFGGDDEGTAAGGDLIAYACREPENEWFAVCVIGADGTGGRQLTHGIPTSEPVWSHDGRELAFTGHTEAGEYTKFDRNDIHVLDADGGEPRQLTHTAEGLSSAEPAWSPDGRRVAFVRGTPVQGAGATFGAIFVMNADGSGVRRLTRGPLDTDPAWSPDGSEIAFTRGTGTPPSTEIHVVSADGGRSRPVTRMAPERASGPAWSPDGSRIAFTWSRLLTFADGKSAIYVVESDGSGVRRLTTYRNYDSFPGNVAWSPDGMTIAFTTSTSLDCTALELLELESGRTRPLTSCGGNALSAESPSWQPADAAGGR